MTWVLLHIFQEKRPLFLGRFVPQPGQPLHPGDALAGHEWEYLQGMGKCCLFPQAAAFRACQDYWKVSSTNWQTQKFSEHDATHKGGRNMSKEEKEQTSQRKPLLVTTPEAGASVWKPSSAPPEDVLQKKFRLQKKLCWFCQWNTFVLILCTITGRYTKWQRQQTKQREDTHYAVLTTTLVQTEVDCPERL